MTAEDLGVWVYALARADRAADRTAGLRGVAEEPVRAVLGGGLAAAVGTVKLDEFRGEGLHATSTTPAGSRPKRERTTRLSARCAAAVL